MTGRFGAISMSAQDGKGALRLTDAVVELRSFAPENLTESYLVWLRDPQPMRFSNQRFRMTASPAAVST